MFRTWPWNQMFWKMNNIFQHGVQIVFIGQCEYGYNQSDREIRLEKIQVLYSEYINNA